MVVQRGAQGAPKVPTSTSISTSTYHLVAERRYFRHTETPVPRHVHKVKAVADVALRACPHDQSHLA